MTPETVDAGITLVEALKTSGPTISFLVAGLFWLAKRMDRVEQSAERIKDHVDARLNNGIKDELSETKQRLANIEGQLAGLPRRKTDTES